MEPRKTTKLVETWKEKDASSKTGQHQLGIALPNYRELIVGLVWLFLNWNWPYFLLFFFWGGGSRGHIETLRGLIVEGQKWAAKAFIGRRGSRRCCAIGRRKSSMTSPICEPIRRGAASHRDPLTSNSSNPVKSQYPPLKCRVKHGAIQRGPTKPHENFESPVKAGKPPPPKKKRHLIETHVQPEETKSQEIRSSSQRNAFSMK